MIRGSAILEVARKREGFRDGDVSGAFFFAGSVSCLISGFRLPKGPVERLEVGRNVLTECACILR